MNRRRFLQTAGALTATGAVAGCTGGGKKGGGGETQTTGAAKKTDAPQLDTFKNKAGMKVGATFDAVKELAQEEDALTVYATIDREPFSIWIKGFQKAHPNVKVNHVTGGSEKLISRWDSEYKSDHVQASIFISTSNVKNTWTRGQTMELKPEFMPSFNAAPEKFKDAQSGNWIATRQVLGSVFYNKNDVDAGAAKTWMDVVTDSAWSDQKIGWDPTPNLFLMSWLLETQGKKFFERLRDQRPRFVDSHTDLARFCGAGEYPVAFTYTHKMGRFGGKLPVDYFKFDPLPSVISPGVVNNKSPTPNSAILFLNWLTSKTGQQVMGKSEYIPWHPEATYKAYPGVYPSDKYEVDTISPETDIKATLEMWKNVMGDLLTG